MRVDVDITNDFINDLLEAKSPYGETVAMIIKEYASEESVYEIFGSDSTTNGTNDTTTGTDDDNTPKTNQTFTAPSYRAFVWVQDDTLLRKIFKNIDFGDDEFGEDSSTTLLLLSSLRMFIERVLQRYALVTQYYSFSTDDYETRLANFPDHHWSVDSSSTNIDRLATSGWLSHIINECEWYHGYEWYDGIQACDGYDSNENESSSSSLYTSFLVEYYRGVPGTIHRDIYLLRHISKFCRPLSLSLSLSLCLSLFVGL